MHIHNICCIMLVLVWGFHSCIVSCLLVVLRVCCSCVVRITLNVLLCACRGFVAVTQDRIHRLAKAAATRDNSIMRTVLTAWRHKAYKCVVHRNIVDNAVARFNTVRMQQGLQAFKAAALAGTHHKCLLYKAAHHHMMMRLWQAWRAWQVTNKGLCALPGQ